MSPPASKWQELRIPEESIEVEMTISIAYDRCALLRVAVIG